MISFLKKYFNILTILLITFIFFWKVFLRNLIIFPGDMLVGAYYPWLDHQWGNLSTGVPIKNPYITDIFSQIFPWKNLIIQSFKQGQWPLWNIFSYSGYPLLANFQSGALNPFNFLFLLFGMINGWNIFLISGVFLSAITMYFYLKIIKKNNLASVIGAITYSFSGFSILWMPYANANYSLAAIPLIFILIENYLKKLNFTYLLLISPLIFFIVSAGHLQILFYSLIITFLYLIFRLKQQKIKFKKKFIIFVPFLLGISLSSIQLLPTFELSNLSIRNDEQFIKTQNYGLSPLGKIITLFSPDFFGNPSTFNYWGFFNYHETNFYVGIIGLVAIVWTIINFRKLKIEKFFLFSGLLSLILCFNTIIGKSIYFLNIPGISTSAAGRVASIFALSSSVLSANYINILSTKNIRNLIKPLIFVVLPSLSILFLVTILKKYFIYTEQYNFANNMNISQRNMVLPFITIFSLLILLIFSHYNKKITIFILLLTTFDLFRFGWKNTPFVSKEYVFPKTPILEYLNKDIDYYRIDRLSGPIIPPNTWIQYNLSSPSGYDPLAFKDYVVNYNTILNKSYSNNVSRYSQLYYLDPDSLGEFNVKYLLLDNNLINKNEYREKFGDPIYTQKSLSLYQNPSFKPRIEILEENSQKVSSANIVDYKPNMIKIKVSNLSQNSQLILRDSYFPGWKAYINETQLEIDKYLNVFRLVKIPKGEYILKFKYEPNSFKIGYIVSITSSITWVELYIFYKKNA